nr:MAG TPA: hypothetical protein [Bacteriophage sp.]
MCSSFSFFCHSCLIISISLSFKPINFVFHLKFLLFQL